MLKQIKADVAAIGERQKESVNQERAWKLIELQFGVVNSMSLLYMGVFASAFIGTRGEGFLPNAFLVLFLVSAVPWAFLQVLKLHLIRDADMLARFQEIVPAHDHILNVGRLGDWLRMEGRPAHGMYVLFCMGAVGLVAVLVAVVSVTAVLAVLVVAVVAVLALGVPTALALTPWALVVGVLAILQATLIELIPHDGV